MQRDSRVFNFYGRVVRVTSLCSPLLGRLEKDFSLYLCTDYFGQIDLQIDCEQTRPSEMNFAHISPSWQSQKVVVYDHEQIRHCVYGNEGLCRFDFQKESARIWSLNLDLLHEITYLMILSRVGKWLDTRGIHRLHACGFRLDQTRVIMTMPMGGGKSTFFVEMAQNYPEIELLGDDTVLIDQKGGVHPFNIRVGLPEKYHQDYQSKTYELKRREYGVKTLLPVEKLGPKPLNEDPWQDPRPDRVILLFGGRASKGASEQPFKKRISRIEAFFELISPMIVGEGLAMILEYFWELGARDFWVKTSIALSRVRAAWQLTKRADCWRVELGTDRGANSHYIRELIRR